MRLRVQQFVTLAGLTAAEAVRQPVCLLLATACILFTALVPFLHAHNFGENGKLARDGGLALHFLLGVLLVGYAASSSLSRELRNGTASAVLSKPVGRDIYFLAKVAGVLVLILLFSVGAAMATLLAERIDQKFLSAGPSAYVTDWQTCALLLLAPFLAYGVAGLMNYWKRRPFTSSAFGLMILFVLAVFLAAGLFNRAGHWAPYDLHVQWRILRASLLVTMALGVLAVVAVSFSTRFGTVTTLTLCLGIFLAGLMSDYLFGRHAESSWLAAIFYTVIPNWQHFWVVDGLDRGGIIPWAYVKQAGIYAVTYAAAVLCLGLISFRRVEMK